MAFLAGTVSKRMLFSGGAAAIAGTPDAPAEALAAPRTDRGRLAWEAYLESAVKAVAVARGVRAARARSDRVGPVRAHRERSRRADATAVGRGRRRRFSCSTGFAAVAMQAAQGAALLADGLAGGPSAALVDALGIREASGTVLDHLHVITPAAARARLGLA